MGKKTKNRRKMNKKNKNDASIGSNRRGLDHPSSNPHPQPRQLCQQITCAVAKDLYERGEYRKAAAHYLDLYRSDVSNPQSPAWFCTFDLFVDTINKANKKDGFIDAKRDIKVLEKFADSELEPSVVRSIAALSASKLHFESRHDLQLAAEFLRQAIAICNSATVDEQCRMVFDCGVMKEVGVVLSETKARCTDLLSEMTKTHSPSTSIYYERIPPGGESCDACGKTRGELGLTHMTCCKRCGMAYYCSAECQSEQWKAGHKQACRKRGKIKVGDVMRIFARDVGPELDGKLVHIIGPVDNTENNQGSDQWKVKLVDVDGPLISVAADNLIHIRPAA